MPRNPVQFQKGMSDADFDRLYGAEDHCRNLRKPEIENEDIQCINILPL